MWVCDFFSLKALRLFVQPPSALRFFHPSTFFFCPLVCAQPIPEHPVCVSVQIPSQTLRLHVITLPRVPSNSQIHHCKNYLLCSCAPACHKKVLGAKLAPAHATTSQQKKKKIEKITPRCQLLVGLLSSAFRCGKDPNVRFPQISSETSLSFKSGLHSWWTNGQVDSSTAECEEVNLKNCACGWEPLERLQRVRSARERICLQYDCANNASLRHRPRRNAHAVSNFFFPHKTVRGVRCPLTSCRGHTRSKNPK